MCGGPEQSNTRSGGSCSDVEVSTHCEAANRSPTSVIDAATAEDNEHISQLLELAASNDLVGFQQALQEQKAKVAGIGSWYGRQSGTAHMVWEQRTPAMIAALYGSVDVLKYILCFTEALESINMKCGSDDITALHCAAAGGSACAIETVKLLLDAGADLHSVDARGRRPADVIAISPKFKHVKGALESLLKAGKSDQGREEVLFDEGQGGLLETDVAGGEPSEFTSSSSISSREAFDGSLSSSPSPSSSPKVLDLTPGKVFGEGNEKVKEYFVDPSIPDIKNSLYTTDEFRMFSFKIRPCSRAYSHDWTECPFVHPGENARRRDPRRYHYSCVPCPDFRKGACRRGDACEYAHGVFECWLHPAQYRTRLCKDGTDCARRVCFFAHTTEELRPLYISSGSTIPCPRTTSPLDMVGLSPPLGPCSPTSALMMSAFSSSNTAQVNLPTPPISPSSSPGNSLAAAWSPTSLPALHLPGVSLQASRLRSSLNARDISVEDFDRAEFRSEFDGQLVGDIPSMQSHALSTQARLNAAVAASGCNTAASRYSSLGLTVPPTSLEELFSSEMVSSPKLFSSDMVSSPKSMVHDPSFLSQMEAKMQLHKASSVHSHVQSQVGSPKLVSISEQFLHMQHTAALESQLQGSPRMVSPPPPFSLGSRGRMTALGGPDIDMQTCNNSVALSPSVIAARSAFAQRDKRSHSSRDLGAGYLLSDWGSPTGKPEWGVQKDDLCKFRKSASFGFRGSEEPDLSWVQKLVKEGPMDGDKDADLGPENGGPREGADLSALKSWMEENMHLDQIVA